MAWECECGHVEYSLAPPQECEKCYKLDSFIQLATEKEIADFDEEELITPKVSLRKSSKLKSSRRKK